MSIRNFNEIRLIENKLRKFDANQATINAFVKESQKILNSNYKVYDKLKELKQSITRDTKTITGVKKVIATKKREVRQERQAATTTRQNVINENLSAITTGFEGNARKALEKVLTKLGTLPSRVRQLPIYYKNKHMAAIKIDKRMTRQQIKDLGNNLSKIMAKNKIKGSIGM
jgi:chromosome segregation ATPase